MISLALALVLSATAQPRPVTFGFFAIQCKPIREVVCVTDNDYPLVVCLSDLPSAINLVNRAVGHEVFRFQGVITPKGIENAYNHGVLPVFGVPTEALPHPAVLAFTVPHVELVKNTPCITRVVMAVGPRIAGLAPWPMDSRLTLAHELVHALGADHAPRDGNYRSRMTEEIDRSLYVPFTRNDIFTLRTVYGE